MVEALPRRIRFYHSKIDSISLASGTGYEELKKVYVILIMPFDPFGENHMIYTIRNRCEVKRRIGSTLCKEVFSHTPYFISLD